MAIAVTPQKKGSNETMSKKTQAYIITNIGALLAMIVVLINMFTLREMWILFTAIAAMIGLAAYTVQEKRKLKQRQIQNHGST
jgi:Flp pilus assembly protein TadB